MSDLRRLILVDDWRLGTHVIASLTHCRPVQCSQDLLPVVGSRDLRLIVGRQMKKPIT